MTTFPSVFARGWAALGGELPGPDTDPGWCELCGHLGERVRWEPKPSWTAFSTHAFPGEGAVCQGCALLLDGGPELASSGRARRWTLFSLGSDGERCEWALKNERGRVRGWIEQGWSVSVADRGKRHVAYLAPVARPGRVCCGLDGERVDVARDDWVGLDRAIGLAIAAGVAKGELVRGRLSQRSWARLGLAHARLVQEQLDRWGGHGALRLAVWLAERPSDGKEDR